MALYNPSLAVMQDTPSTPAVLSTKCHRWIEDNPFNHATPLDMENPGVFLTLGRVWKYDGPNLKREEFHEDFD